MLSAIGFHFSIYPLLLEFPQRDGVSLNICLSLAFLVEVFFLMTSH